MKTKLWKVVWTKAALRASSVCFLFATASAAVFNIDPERSNVTLSGNALGFSLQEQSAGSLATKFAGTINAVISNNTIEFAGGSLIAAQNSGSWEPKGNGETGNAPANYGGKASGGMLGSVVAAVRSSQFNVTSVLLAVTANQFDSRSLMFQFLPNSPGTLDYSVSGLLAAKGSIALAGLATNRVTSQATIVTSGNTQTLTIPLTADFFFRLVSPNDTKLTISGQLIATRSLDANIASDNFAGRPLSSSYPLRLTASNATATKEAGEPNHAANVGGHSLWWGWIAPVAGEVTVTTAGSDFDTVLAVYSGDTLAALNAIASDDRGKSDEQIKFHAAAGASSNIAVDGYNGTTGNVVVNISFVPSPPNDDFANRIALTGSSISVTTTNAAATKEPGEPTMIAGFAGGSSLWWSWTPPVTGILTATTEGTVVDALLSIWTGTVVSNLTSVAQQDRQPFESISVRVEGGTSYALAIDGYQGRVGKTVLNLSFVPSPVNDDFAQRTPLSGTDISLTVSNVAATFEPNEPRHAGKPGGKSVWWTWTPSGTGPAMISTEGSAFDTLLAVYTGNTLNALTEIVSKDMTLGDTVSFSAAAGTAYQIAVDGYNGVGGGFPLRVTQSVSLPLSSSTFDSSLDFWTVVSFSDLGPFTNIAGGPFTPSLISTNGNPGGYISQSDPDSNTWFWNAPPKLLGNQSGAYGGRLKFDLRQSATDSQFMSADVILNGQAGTLVFTYTNYPGTNWTTYDLPLVAGAGWRKESLDGAPPTEAEFQSVLQSLIALRIRGEYRVGGDIGDLDNVSWGAPASVVLFDNGNIFGVQSGPRAPTVFTLAQPVVITFIQDYHYFNNGASPGTISLRHDDGTVYGPWQTRGQVGQGGVNNAYWIAEPMVEVKAGQYTVIDSNPVTWSHNSASGFAGFTLIKGYAVETESPKLSIALESDGRIALSWPSALTGFTVVQSATIAAPSYWLTIPETPVTESDRFVIRITRQAQTRFYRLNK